MCGIAGIHFFNVKNTGMTSVQLEDLVNELFKKNERRGRDSSGIATIRGNSEVFIEKCAIPAEEFIKHRSSVVRKAKSILIHTRAKTKGAKENNYNNHPIDYKNATIIHNGSIRNDDELFKSEDVTRIAQVDSEIIAALFNKYGLEKAHIPLQKLEGGFAIAAIDQRHPTALVLAKGRQSPLHYFRNDKFLVWSSESYHLVESLKKVDFDVKYLDIMSLSDGDIFYIDHGKMEKLQFVVKQSTYTTPAKTAVTNNRGAVIGYNRDHDDDYFGSHHGYVPYNQEDVITIDLKKKDEKDDKFDLEPKRKNIPKNGSYTVYGSMGKKMEYRLCWDCERMSVEEYLTNLNGQYFCEPCLEKEKEELKSYGVEINVIDGEAFEVNGAWDTTSEARAEEDRILSEFDENELEKQFESIMTVMAKEFKVPEGMIEFLLFDCEELIDGLVENEHIVSLYASLADRYDDLLKGHDLSFTSPEDETSKEVVIRPTPEQVAAMLPGLHWGL